MAIQQEGVKVRLGLDVTEFERGLENTKRTVDTWGGRISKILSTVSFGMLGGGLGFAAIGSFFSGIYEKAANLGKTAQALSVSVQTLQAVQRMARKSGEEESFGVEKLDHLNRVIGEARTGSEEASAKFTKLKIALNNTDDSARSTDEIFGDVMSRLHDMPDAASRSAAAFELMRGSTARWTAELAKGKEHLQALQLSAAYDQSMVDQVKEADTKVSGWKAAMHRGIVLTLANWNTSAYTMWDNLFNIGTDKARNELSENMYSPALKRPDISKNRKVTDEELQKKQAEAEAHTKKTLELSQQISKANEGIETAEQESYRLVRGTNEWKLKNAELEIKMADRNELITKQTKEQSTWEEKKNTLLAQRTELLAKQSQQSEDLERGKSDRSAFTLQEIAQGTLSRNVSPMINRDILLARRVQWDEAFAKRARGLGRWDLSDKATDQALDLRSRISTLTSSEQTPFQGMERQQVETNVRLAAIDAKLANFNGTQDPG